MANFRLTNTRPDAWTGGPPQVCAACQFHSDTYKWYVVMEGVFAESGYDIPGGSHVDASLPVLLCSDHATELKGVLDEVLPDDRMSALKGKLLQAEAARARAEKRAEKAEAALHAMQDWIAEDSK